MASVREFLGEQFHRRLIKVLLGLESIITNQKDPIALLHDNFVQHLQATLDWARAVPLTDKVSAAAKADE